MSRCPACFLNFRALVCDFSCSPKQNEFVVVESEQLFNRALYEKQKKLLEIENSISDDEDDDQDDNDNDGGGGEEKKNRVKKEQLELNPLKITETIDLEQTNETQVTSIRTFMTSYFAEKIYNACKYELNFLISNFNSLANNA